MRNNRTLTVVNTSRRTSSDGRQNTTVTQARASASVGGSSSASATHILNIISPIIGENYADTVTRLMSASYLQNPAFANNAENWTISEEDANEKRTAIVISDNKVRIRLRDTGCIMQENALIRKPGKHKEYTVTPETEDNGTSGDNSTEGETFTPSSELVTGQVTWEEITEPKKTEGEQEKQDLLYLSLSYICKEAGTLHVGFVGADESAEDALKLQSVTVNESDEVHTITAQGTWDGTGDFKIYNTQGEFEIIALALLDKPLDEYRKQTDSLIKQMIENIEKAYVFIHEVIKRISLLQSHINQLYSNDAVFKETTEEQAKQITTINETLTKHDERITAAQADADTAFDWAYDNWYDIYYELRPNIETNKKNIDANALLITTNINSIKTNTQAITNLQTSLNTLSENLAALEERVAALEPDDSGETTG